MRGSCNVTRELGAGVFLVLKYAGGGDSMDIGPGVSVREGGVDGNIGSGDVFCSCSCSSGLLCSPSLAVTDADTPS